MAKFTRLLAAAALLARSVAAQEDPGANGPYTPGTLEFYPGEVRTLNGVEVEIMAKVHTPGAMSNGPYPLVLFLHGKHDPSVPSYLGYDYVASALASHGMIVASISANGINAGANNLDIGARMALIQYHLDRWAALNSTGVWPFTTTFVGKVDLNRIALVGHSRGGQAVLNVAATNPPAGLKAVMAVGPSNTGSVRNVPLAILIGYCDGDNTGDLRGVSYVDQSRYGVGADNSPKYTILGWGANHNFFNSEWGPGVIDERWPDDGHCGSNSVSRLSEEEQQDFGRAYIAAFLRKHLLGQRQFDSILNGDALSPPSASGASVHIGYLPGDNDRKDLNRLDQDSATNTLEGEVRATGAVTADRCGGSSSLAKCISADRDTHWPNGYRLPAVLLTWTGAGTYSNALPQFKRDISNFSTLQFRVTVDHTYASNYLDVPANFSVRLTGADGRTSTVVAGNYSEALYHPPGDHQSPARASIMNTLRIPLEAFGEVDMTNVASVALVFGTPTSGRIVVSDIAFTDKGTTTTAAKWLASGF